MKKLFSTIKKYICPKVEKEIKNDIDRVSLRNIRAISLVVLVLELYGLIITVIEQIKGGDVSKTLLSVSFCVSVCLFSFIFAQIGLKKKMHNHILVTCFCVFLAIMLIAWGMNVSYLHYVHNEQILTFFTVIIVIDCFFIMEPVISIPLISISFIAYYYYLHSVDGGAMLNEFNYFTMGIVCVAGAVTRYINVLKRLREKREVHTLNEQIKNDLTKQELELSNTKIKLLQTQIEPHYIYNALGMIKSLVWEDKDKAIYAINEFSIYLRSNIDAIENDDYISFAKELEHIKAFLALEKIDDASEISIEYNIETENFELPPLTVEPLVENALIHGVSQNEKSKKIVITTAEKEGCYIITVQDNGGGFDVANVKESTGLNNVRTRLKYSCNGKLMIKSDETGTVATIYIPKK